VGSTVMMIQIIVALGAINLIFLVVAVVFMATLNGKCNRQQESITFIFRRAKEEQRRQQRKEELLLQKQTRGKRR